MPCQRNISKQVSNSCQLACSDTQEAQGVVIKLSSAGRTGAPGFAPLRARACSVGADTALRAVCGTGAPTQCRREQARCDRIERASFSRMSQHSFSKKLRNSCASWCMNDLNSSLSCAGAHGVSDGLDTRGVKPEQAHSQLATLGSHLLYPGNKPLWCNNPSLLLLRANLQRGRKQDGDNERLNCARP